MTGLADGVLASGSTVPTWSLWVPVVAAIGASLLTGLATWGVTLWGQRRTAQEERNRARRVAYVDLLEATTEVTLAAQTMGQVLRFRTGPSEGLHVLLRLRAPIEPLALYDRFSGVMAGLLDAQARVWLVGTQEAVDAADAVTEAAGAYIDIAVAATGHKQTMEHARRLDAQLRTLALARAQFLHVIRDEIGEVPVVLSIDRREEPQP